MEKEHQAYIHIILVNEFGNKAEVKLDLMDSSIHAVIENIRIALMGLGFSPENVNEYLPEI